MEVEVFVLLKEHGHLHAGNSAWKAVGGGIHWYVESLYQVSPNVHSKCVLLSKCNWVAMWLSNSYHRKYTTGDILNHPIYTVQS